MIWPYLFGLVFLMPDGQDRFLDVFLNVYLIGTLAVYTLNIWNAVTWRGEGAADRLAGYDMAVKLAHIPFYLGVFAVGVLFLLAMVVPAFGFVSPIVISMLAVVDYLLMLTSSSYGICAALRLARAGRITKRGAAVHVVLHLLFMTDVVSAVYLFRRSRRQG
ncbi:MAG: hypothetical protein IJ751_00645 [Oscillospiraceae bacterium]|nr:hypothetical protein [Oscillospiraceae bacterium]